MLGEGQQKGCRWRVDPMKWVEPQSTLLCVPVALEWVSLFIPNSRELEKPREPVASLSLLLMCRSMALSETL